MKKIKVFVVFQEDSDVVKKGDSYAIELPDFLSYTPNYSEENRKEIKKFYSQIADCDCTVIFDFEMPAIEKN